MKRVDLTGMTFGKLHVICRDEEISAAKKHHHWKCQCACGNIFVADGYQLMTGQTVTCGCGRFDRARKSAEKRLQDLSGKRFGMLTALYRCNNEGKSGTWWLCKCDCGKEKKVTAGHLVDGHTTHCGCKKDLVGKKFGMLTVLSKAPPQNPNMKTAWWNCVCDCGNTAIVSTQHLKTAKPPCCGCLNSEKLARGAKGKYRDISGTRFGHLVAVEIDRARTTYGRTYWKCKCDCGREISTHLSSLTDGSSRSCGLCGHKSYGEEKIARILKENNIPFRYDVTFPTCVNSRTGYKYRFDFFVDDKYIIEYDGCQHFTEPPGLWSEKQSIESRRQSDMEKNMWCVENNIPIIRIPYVMFDDLTIDDLVPETAEYVIQGRLSGWAYLLPYN